MQLKFKSGVNKLLVAAVVIYHIIIALLFSTKYFSMSNFGVNVAIALCVVDIVLILPMLFMTYYEFKTDYLYIHDYPFRAYKIKYSDIFTVEDGDFETKDKSIVALSLDRIAIGYTRINSKNEEEKRYVFISPKDMSLFLIRLSARLKQCENEATERAKELSEKQIEHNRKKEIADRKREEERKANAPEIIKVKGAKKGSFKVEEAEADKDKE